MIDSLLFNRLDANYRLQFLNESKFNETESQRPAVNRRRSQNWNTNFDGLGKLRLALRESKRIYSPTFFSFQTVRSRKFQITVEKNLPQVLTCRLAQL